jgi:molybdopterin converting factor subunit 1
MKHRVLLFAVARQRVGCDSVEIELPAQATVAELRQALSAGFPPLADIVPHARFAINNEYAAESAAVPAASEIALIPPVSGG